MSSTPPDLSSSTFTTGENKDYQRSTTTDQVPPYQQYFSSSIYCEDDQSQHAVPFPYHYFYHHPSLSPQQQYQYQQYNNSPFSRSKTSPTDIYDQSRSPTKMFSSPKTGTPQIITTSSPPSPHVSSMVDRSFSGTPIHPRSSVHSERYPPINSHPTSIPSSPIGSRSYSSYNGSGGGGGGSLSSIDISAGGGGGITAVSRAPSRASTSTPPPLEIPQADGTEKGNFLHDLYSFMANIGQPITKTPFLGYQELDLFLLYKLVISRGGMDEVTRAQEWKNVYIDLGIPTMSTSASYNTRTNYKKYLYLYELENADLDEKARPQGCEPHWKIGDYVRIVSSNYEGVVFYGKVVKCRWKSGKNMYYIHYNGWGSSHDEWMPEEVLSSLLETEKDDPETLINPTPTRSSKSNYIIGDMVPSSASTLSLGGEKEGMMITSTTTKGSPAKRKALGGGGGGGHHEGQNSGVHGKKSKSNATVSNKPVSDVDENDDYDDGIDETDKDHRKASSPGGGGRRTKSSVELGQSNSSLKLKLRGGHSGIQIGTHVDHENFSASATIHGNTLTGATFNRLQQIGGEGETIVYGPNSAMVHEEMEKLQNEELYPIMTSSTMTTTSAKQMARYLNNTNLHSRELIRAPIGFKRELLETIDLRVPNLEKLLGGSSSVPINKDIIAGNIVDDDNFSKTKNEQENDDDDDERNRTKRQETIKAIQAEMKSIKKEYQHKKHLIDLYYNSGSNNGLVSTSGTDADSSGGESAHGTSNSEHGHGDEEIKLRRSKSDITTINDEIYGETVSVATAMMMPSTPPKSIEKKSPKTLDLVVSSNSSPLTSPALGYNSGRNRRTTRRTQR